ncbi:MAG: type pilus assembly protein PilA [Solirubrobacteraceae bacterium]|jgi:type IV pilus assembly protein PilA|nr:type pilus assembly protein PilA [Solirubrobacteraceae bacterium]
MLQRLRQRAADEKGFTLIELLVVILIIGILAAIAIPSFLNQKGKANDANAKAVVRTAQTAEETYFTDNQAYATTASALGVIEDTLVPAISATPANVPHSLTVSAPTPASGYDVSVISGANSPVTYHIINTGGTITRTCLPVSTGGCNASGTW